MIDIIINNLFSSYFDNPLEVYVNIKLLIQQFSVETKLHDIFTVILL